MKKTALVSLRRFVGTVSGTFLVEPGLLLDSQFDASEQVWFKQSMNSPSAYAFTRAGYGPTSDPSIITISKVARHPANGYTFGVTGIDLHSTTMNAIVVKAIPQCSGRNVTCVLLDSSGYLLTEPPTLNADGAWQHVHVAQKYNRVFAGIIRRGQYIKAKWCRQITAQKTSQLFYELSDGEPPISHLSGAECDQYHLHNIPGTNLHLLIVGTELCNRSVMQYSCACNSTCTVCSLNVTSPCQCPCSCITGTDDCGNRFDVAFPPVTCPGALRAPRPPSVSHLPVTPCSKPCVLRLNVTDCLEDTNCTWCNSSRFETTPLCLTQCYTPFIRTSTPEPVTTTPTIVAAPCNPQMLENNKESSALATGLGVPLGILSALSLAGLIAFLMKRVQPPPSVPPTKVQPVESFVPNIYRASMGDDLAPQVGRPGFELEQWNSRGQAMFGRPSIVQT